MIIEKIEVGDIYEDCSYHPCLCTSVNFRKDDIQGISLIDGSSPRSCSLKHCGVRKLTIEEAVLWKKKGPADLNAAEPILPDMQWWMPKPETALNPGNVAEHLFYISLNFLRNQKPVTDRLGRQIIGWFDPEFELIDNSKQKKATASYTVKGETASALIHVEAKREARGWPMQSINVKPNDGAELLEFSGSDMKII